MCARKLLVYWLRCMQHNRNVCGLTPAADLRRTPSLPSSGLPTSPKYTYIHYKMVELITVVTTQIQIRHKLR